MLWWESLLWLELTRRDQCYTSIWLVTVKNKSEDSKDLVMDQTSRKTLKLCSQDIVWRHISYLRHSHASCFDLWIWNLTQRARTSAGEVWFGSVWATFSQTGNQTVWFLARFPKPKPKLIQTIYISLVWFKLGLRLLIMATLAQTDLSHKLTLANRSATAPCPASTAFINRTLYCGRITCKT